MDPTGSFGILRREHNDYVVQPNVIVSIGIQCSDHYISTGETIYPADSSYG